MSRRAAELQTSSELLVSLDEDPFAVFCKYLCERQISKL
jgi:hypothetical protein